VTGRPFLIHGDTPWSLIVQLTYEEALVYLDDRRARGFDTVLVNLIEHQFADDPPNNRAGEGPFLVPGDLSTPNDAYFDHAERVVVAAADRGIAVFLTPAYLGYGGGAEGWFAEMEAMDVSGCRAYGDAVAARFADDQNVLWVHGGDFAPPAGSNGNACALEILAALQEGDPDALHTMHWARHSTSLDEPAWAAAVDLNAVYTDELSYPRCLEAFERDPPVPAFFIEGRYEGESGTPASLRAQHYWAALSAIGGQLMGNRPVWPFAEGWQDALGSTLARDMGVLGGALESRRWYDLVPDAAHALVVGGGGTAGGTDWVAAASTSDGTLAIAYLPAGGAVTIDFSRLADGLEASWVDPTNGATTRDPGSPFPNAGPATLTPPGPNASGDVDWALVIE
jgi:hypothetical protein